MKSNARLAAVRDCVRDSESTIPRSWKATSRVRPSGALANATANERDQSTQLQPIKLFRHLVAFLSSVRRKRYSLSVKLRRHLRTFFALLLAGLWITTASWAEHVSAEFPLCQPAHSPCCPQPVNNSSESCPACHISDTVAAKKTLEHERERSKSLPQIQNWLSHQANPLVTAPPRELTPGLCYRPTVFDLKDDLHI